MYHVGIVLRENGRVEVYANFMKVSEYMNNMYPAVDVETTTEHFFLKCVD